MSKKEKIKKINNGIGDLSFIVAATFFIGIIVVIINVWGVIKVSVDTYIENKNNNIVEYTKNFIETEKDEDLYIEDIEYIETKTDANVYMASYISDKTLTLIINIIFVFAYYQLFKFFEKENIKNPFEKKAISYLKKALKIMNRAFIIWFIGEILIFTIFLLAPAYYDSINFDIILYLIITAFIQFIIYLLEKGELKKDSKESNL